MSWKKILIATGLFIFVLIAAFYVFLAFYDFNKLKPMIAKTVKDATGRELAIAGNIDFDMGIRPTLVVEDVSFQNAAWGSKPNLARVKRLEVQIAIWPLISGNFDFVHVVLIEPDVIMEFDSAGTSNFSFDPSSEEEKDAAIPPPPLIFSDVSIEKGLFTYEDAQSDIKFFVRIDRLKVDIPGFDKSLQLDFEGAFNDILFTLDGTLGPIWAWVEPGYTLPANLTLKAGGATAKIDGEIRAPASFKDLAFTIAAEGASTVAIAKLVGVTDIPELGAFKLAATVADTAGPFAIEGLDIKVGSEDLVAISITGNVKNVPALQGIKLDFSARGRDVANLTQLGMPPLPKRGAFEVSADISDPTAKVFSVSDLKLKLGENNITGSLDLNLDGKQLRLAADLAAPQVTLQPVTLTALEELSRIEDLGPLKLAIKLAGAGNKLALDNLDFNLGREDLIEVLLKGTISDLSAVRGMKLEFTARGNNMSLFKKLGGPEMPFEGAFNVSAQFIDPAPKVYKIPVFNAVWGDNKGNGWLELDLSAKRPRLKGELSSDKLDLRPLFVQDKKKSIVKAQSIESAPKKDQKPKSKTDPSKSGIQKAKVFPSKSLPLGGLQVIDADLKFRDKQLLLPALVLDDVIVDVLLKDDNLQIKPFKFTIDGGKADIQFALRSQEKPAALAATLNIDQLEIGPLIDELGYQRSVEGNMDAALNLDSSGDSVAALMAGLNGNIRITMSDGRAASEYLDLLEKYLGSGILRILNPFQEKRKYASINCFVNTIEIKDGLADVKLLLDTDRTSIFGAGDINLKTERLDLGIKPTPKKGAGPADFSLSLKVLSQPFRLGGTLANPSLVIDPGRAAFVVGRLAGALALGPFGIASFFGDISVGKKDPCKVALQAAKQQEQTLEGKKADESTKKADTKKKMKKRKSLRDFSEGCLTSKPYLISYNSQQRPLTT